MSEATGFIEIGPARHIQSSYSVFFSRKSRIVESTPLLNEIFEPLYHPAQEIDVPAGADADFPRLIFVSQHGFSQIVVAANSIALNIQYSPEWQGDFSKGLGYLRERIPLLTAGVNSLNASLLYMGMSSTAQFVTMDDDALVRTLARVFGGGLVEGDPHELNVRVANTVEGKYFNNVSLRNYRNWPVSPLQLGGVRLDRGSAADKGLEVAVDLNDRFAFNEVPNYRSNSSSWVELMNKFVSTYSTLLDRLESGKW